MITAYKGPATQAAQTSGNPYAPGGTMRVTKREYITDFGASAAAPYVAVNYGFINPGNVGMFPWLSAIANQFESYRFTRLKFILKSEAPSTTAGSQFLVWDQNPDNQLPGAGLINNPGAIGLFSKAELLQYKNAARGGMWQDVELAIPRSDQNALGSWKFVTGYQSKSGLGLSIDPKTYFDGILIVAQQQSGGVPSELYVEYTVELKDPISVKIGPNGVSNVNLYSVKYVGNGTISKSAIFGATPIMTWAGNQQLGPVAAVASGSVLRFNLPGQYKISIYTVCTTPVNPAFSMSAGSTGSFLQYVYDTADGTSWDEFVVTVIDGGSITFNYTGDASVTASTTRIALYPYDVAA